MKALILSTILIFITFFLGPAVMGQTQAGFLTFDKDTVVANIGDIFDVQIIVDPGSEQISSDDAYVIYDPSLIEAQGVTPLDYFPTVVNNIESGRVYVAGLVDDPATYKTGSGAIATVSFRALAEGLGTLTYDCQPGVYNSSKIIKNDLHATNIIECDQNGRVNITVGSGIGVGDGITVTPSGLPQTGVFENVAKIAIQGMILLLLGGMLRAIL